MMRLVKSCLHLAKMASNTLSLFVTESETCTRVVYVYVCVHITRFCISDETVYSAQSKCTGVIFSDCSQKIEIVLGIYFGRGSRLSDLHI